MPSLEEILGIVVGAPTAKPKGALERLMPPAVPDPAASFYRSDGSRKGRGFLGELKGKDGRTSTELSIGVEIGGKQMEIPSLVPTLDPAEVQHLLGGGEMTDAIVKKAVDHARMRMQQGLPVFSE